MEDLCVTMFAATLALIDMSLLSLSGNENIMAGVRPSCINK